MGAASRVDNDPFTNRICCAYAIKGHSVLSGMALEVFTSCYRSSKGDSKHNETTQQIRPGHTGTDAVLHLPYLVR